MLERLPQDKKKQNQPQKKAQSKKAPGLVNANHFYETSEELANRQIEAGRQQAQSAQRKQAKQNPEGPG
ncbi:MAG: hypothetical protein GX199_07885 [Firmicutes bacterium]|nr:hypothetical protein [Bacillota bacterium]